MRALAATWIWSLVVTCHGGVLFRDPTGWKETEKLLGFLDRADWQGVDHVLVDAAREGGKAQLKQALAGLAAQGYDPQDVQAWLGRRKDQVPRSWLRDQKTIGPHDIAEGFWELQKGLQMRSRSISVGAIQMMTAKGGTRRIESGLRGLEVLGYDSKEIHGWLLGGTDQGAAPLTKQASLERAKSDAHDLAQQLQKPNRETVKHSLAAVLNDGGQKRVEAAFSQLEVMGYNGLELHNWLNGKSQNPPSQSMPSKTTSTGNLSVQATHKQDAHTSGTRSEKETAAQVKLPPTAAEIALSKLINKLPKSFSVRSGEETPTSATHDAGTTNTEIKNSVALSSTNSTTLAIHDAEEIGRYVGSSDRRGLQRFFKSLLGHGGKPRVETALAGLREVGYDPAAVHMWLSKGGTAPHWSKPKADPLNVPVSPSATSKPKTSSGVDGPRAQSTPQRNNVSRLPVVEGAPAKLPINETSKETITLATRDATEISHYLDSSDRQGLQRFFKSLLGHGGKPEIEKALAGLRELGYDPAAVHTWLSKGGAVPIKADPTPAKAVPDKAAPVSPSSLGNSAPQLAKLPIEEESPTSATHDAEEIQHYIKSSDRAGLQRLLNSFIGHGGRSRVVEALEDVKKLGYDPTSLHTWLAKAGEVPQASIPERNSENDETSAPGGQLDEAKLKTKRNDVAFRMRSETSQAKAHAVGEGAHIQQQVKLEYRQLTNGDSVHVVGPIQVGPLEVNDAQPEGPRDKPNAPSDRPKVSITKSVRLPVQAKTKPEREEQVPHDMSSSVGPNRFMDVNVVRVNRYQVYVKPQQSERLRR